MKNEMKHGLLASHFKTLASRLTELEITNERSQWAQFHVVSRQWLQLGLGDRECSLE